MNRERVRRQPAEKRIKNFFEVALGYGPQEAEREAQRCLGCKDKSCVKGCPVEADIPRFIQLIKEGNPREALRVIKEKNTLPAICGRVCPQEEQCEAVCLLGKKKAPVNIGALERYAADYGKVPLSHQSPVTSYQKGMKVAVVGSGPAGLTAAAELARMGYRVTIFESLHVAGGVLSYGIPEFRLPKKILGEEVEFVHLLGAELKTNVLIGRTLTIKDLFADGFKAVFLGTGAGLPNFLGIEGENAAGVYSANEFLTRVNLMRAYEFPKSATPVKVGKNTIVIGGGNVALDSARCAKRLGSHVTVVYRRSEAQMPARREEIENAKEEGIEFLFLTSPKRFLVDPNGCVKGLECLKMKLGQKDSSGRPRPVKIEGSELPLNATTVIVAIGQSPNPLVFKTTPDLKVTQRGTIAVNEQFMTSIPGVFAGGDITSGAATVISAMGAGKKAAREIDHFLMEKNPKGKKGEQ